MRLGVFIPQFTPEAGGAYSFQESIIEAFGKLNSMHKIYVFYYGEKDYLSDPKINYISIRNKPKLNLKNNLKLKIKKLLSKIGFKNIRLPFSLSEAVKENNIELIWFMSLAFEEVNIPFIYTVWDLQHRLQPFFPEVSVSGWEWEDREKMYSKILPRATYVFTGTERGKEEIIQFYRIDSERIKVIPLPTPSFCFNPVNLDDKKNNLSLLKYIDSKFLFYPAQFWPHKNHIGLLYAFKLIKEKYRLKFKLILTGSDTGNLDFVKIKIKELGLSDEVIIRGFVSADELVALYKSAFAMVFPSLFGPDNLPPLEAFAFGCPVVAANVPGGYEQLGDAALLVDSKNEESLALAVKVLHDNSLLRNELIEKGKVRAVSWTSIDYVNRLIEIIDEFGRYRRCWSNTEEYLHL